MNTILKYLMLLFLSTSVFSQNPDFDEDFVTTGGYNPPQSPYLVSGYWSSLSSSPMAVSRSCCAFVEINGVPYLYQFGGGNSSSEMRRVARLNLSTNTWQNNVSTMPTQISAGTAVTMNDGSIYVFGGNLSPGTLGKTLKYNPSNNTWETKANMMTAITDALVIKYDESRIIIVGGGDGYFGASAMMTNKVQVYNTVYNYYSYTTNFPIPCAMLGGGIYRDTIITVGGYTSGGNATANCYKGVINPSTLSINWQPISSYPGGSITRVASFTAVRNTGVGILCSGGAIGGSVATSQTHFWNFCTQQWMPSLPSNTMARTNYKASGHTNGFLIYAAGGYTNTGVGTTEFITMTQIDGPCQNMVGVGNNNNSLPEKFELKQNYPNPFNPQTKITFSLPEGGLVKITVRDISGREVFEITNKLYNAGTHSIEFSGSELSSGVYFYTINAGSFKDTKKMLLVK